MIRDFLGLLFIMVGGLHLIGVLLVFFAIDIFTGLLKAVYNADVSGLKLSKRFGVWLDTIVSNQLVVGVMRKSSQLLIVFVVAILVAILPEFVETFPQINDIMPILTKVPKAVVGIFIFGEFKSIIENLKAVGVFTSKPVDSIVDNLPDDLED